MAVSVTSPFFAPAATISGVAEWPEPTVPTLTQGVARGSGWGSWLHLTIGSTARPLNTTWQMTYVSGRSPRGLEPTEGHRPSVSGRSKVREVRTVDGALDRSPTPPEVVLNLDRARVAGAVARLVVGDVDVDRLAVLDRVASAIRIDDDLVDDAFRIIERVELQRPAQLALRRGCPRDRRKGKRGLQRR